LTNGVTILKDWINSTGKPILSVNTAWQKTKKPILNWHPFSRVPFACFFKNNGIYRQ
jgi:hypothetical protein